MSRTNVIKELTDYIKSNYSSAQVIEAGECTINDDRLQYDQKKLADIKGGVYFFLYEDGRKYGCVRQNKRSIQAGLNLVRYNVATHGFSILYNHLKNDKIDKIYLYVITGHAKIRLENIKTLVEKFFKERKGQPNKKNDTKYEEIINLLKFKKQIILQGAPGTGKTYTAKEVAKEMGCKYEIVQFHPSYTYEDFVRGIVAKTDNNGNIKYEVEDKILMNAIKKAENSEKPYILIIDEINRANLSSVLGELLYALEYRGEPVICPYKKSGEDNGKIEIPKNLYIIGTMNTTDRSIGSIDYAIIRRFAFYNMLSDISCIKDKNAIEIYKNVEDIIENYHSSEYDINDIMIGHSYFIFDDKINQYEPNRCLELSLQYNIIPLLKEYYKDGILVDNDDVDMSVIDSIEELNEYIK